MLIPKGNIRLKTFSRKDVKMSIADTNRYLQGMTEDEDSVSSALASFSGNDAPLVSTSISLKPFVSSVSTIVAEDKQKFKPVSRLKLNIKFPGHQDKLKAVLNWLSKSSLRFDPLGLSLSLFDVYEHFDQQLVVDGEKSFTMIKVDDDIVKSGKCFMMKTVRTNKTIKMTEMDFKSISTIAVTIYKINIDGGAEIVNIIKIPLKDWTKKLNAFENAYHSRNTRYSTVEDEFIFVNNFDLCQFQSCAQMIKNGTCMKMNETVFSGSYIAREYYTVMKAIIKECGKSIDYVKFNDGGINTQPDHESDKEAARVLAYKIRHLFSDYGFITLNDKSIKMNDWFMMNWMPQDIFGVRNKVKNIFKDSEDETALDEFVVAFNVEMINNIISLKKFSCTQTYDGAVNF